MNADDLDYDLPASAIAQTPMEPRDHARLLVPLPSGAVRHDLAVRDLPGLLSDGDVLVVNDTRVIPARLNLRKPTGGAVEVLLLERRPEGHWEALVRPGGRVAPGTVLTGPGGIEAFGVVVGEVLGDDGRRSVRIDGGELDDLAVLASAGEVPLPPYIHEPLTDPERYQTIYADRPGSVAAPTAGLHITEGVMAGMVGRGVTVARVELQVGLGTFRPITAQRVQDHPMHAERYRIPSSTLDAIASCSGQVVAVGTTVVRALEAWAATGETEAATSLFIHGAYRFSVVDRLMTNFHVPRSSLLAMIEAFAGPSWRNWYREALENNYRFLSFGDAMLLDRRTPDYP